MLEDAGNPPWWHLSPVPGWRVGGGSPTWWLLGSKEGLLNGTLLKGCQSKPAAILSCLSEGLEGYF